MRARRASCPLALAALVAAALLVGGAPASCHRPDGRPPDLVVIVLDTVRVDYVSAYGDERPTTPFLEELARAGTRFERAYSTSSWTLPAHGSLFTGALPETHRANQTHLRVADSLPVLAEQLAAAGYQTAAFSNNTWVSERAGLDRGFEHFANLWRGYRDRVKAQALDRAGAARDLGRDATVSALRRWLAEERDPARPAFVFVNLVEPHMPYVPSWEEVRAFLGSNDARWAAFQSHYPDSNELPLMRRHYQRQRPLDEAEWEDLRALYRGELREADRVTRELVRALDAAGDPDRTLLFVLSDHGENLGEHGHLAHVFNVYDTSLRIPLIARGPGFAAGAVDERLVSIADLYPTLLAAAGLEAGPQAVGHDLRGELPSERELLATLEVPRVSLRMFPRALQPGLANYAHGLRAAIGPRYKLIRRSDGAEELYDLREDPGEERPLDPAGIDPAALARLRAALDRPVPRADGSAGVALEDPEALRALRQMGYVDEDG